MNKTNGQKCKSQQQYLSTEEHVRESWCMHEPFPVLAVCVRSAFVMRKLGISLVGVGRLLRLGAAFCCGRP